MNDGSKGLLDLIVLLVVLAASCAAILFVCVLWMSR
jgi:hypothetical protein